MFKKMMEEAAQAAMRAQEQVRKAVEDGMLKEKLTELNGGAPMPLSGLAGTLSGLAGTEVPGSGSAKGSGRRKQRPETIRQEDRLPGAAVRDEALEARLLALVNVMPELAGKTFSLCLLRTDVWNQVKDWEVSSTDITGRQRYLYAVGRDVEGRNLVYQLEATQLKSQSVEIAQINDDRYFDPSPITLSLASNVVYQLPDSAMSEEVELTRRVGVSPVTVHNTMDIAIKVQSSNSETEDYVDLIIPPRTKKVFMYLSEGNAFFIREAERSRLIKSLDPTAPGFGFEDIHV